MAREDEGRFDPAKQSWADFLADSAKRSAAYAEAEGQREAKAIYAESPAEAARLLGLWEAALPGMADGMDRDKIRGACEEFRRLLA
jgi:hypothetical protein